MTTPLSIGYSPCPNDTYIFYGLTHGKVLLPDVQLAEPLLEDVETLNSWAVEKKLDITKLSFHALGDLLVTLPGAAAGKPIVNGKGQTWGGANRPRPCVRTDQRRGLFDQHYPLGLHPPGGLEPADVRSTAQAVAAEREVVIPGGQGSVLQRAHQAPAQIVNRQFHVASLAQVHGNGGRGIEGVGVDHAQRRDCG